MLLIQICFENVPSRKGLRSFFKRIRVPGKCQFLQCHIMILMGLLSNKETLIYKRGYCRHCARTNKKEQNRGHLTSPPSLQTSKVVRSNNLLFFFYGSNQKFRKEGLCSDFTNKCRDIKIILIFLMFYPEHNTQYNIIQWNV